MLAIISDIHSNTEALQAVLADMESHGAEQVVCLGDFVGYGAFPEPTVCLLREACGRSVLGNYDRKVLRFPRKAAEWQNRKTPAKFLAFQWAYEHLSPDSRRYLRSLPQQMRFTVGRCRVLLTHAGGASASTASRAGRFAWTSAISAAFIPSTVRWARSGEACP